MSELIFNKSVKNRRGVQVVVNNSIKLDKTLPDNILRKSKINLPEVSELQVVRHFTNLSKKNFSIDSEFYPLGSCTMKYNPRAAHKLAQIPEFLSRHPLALEKNSQGFLECMYDLQNMLKAVTGMHEVSLTPMAGAQGEFAGIRMIKAYHNANKDFDRIEMLVPDAAHGTNPASAVMCGFKVKEIKTLANGDLDLEELKKSVSSKTAGIMLTNPSTLGVFEKDILDIAKIIHDNGGLLYYDGANLNAILGNVKPAEMGFDVMHMNLHKTFATPHGGGGPGSGPVACVEKLAKFLPTPVVEKNDGGFYFANKKTRENTIGRLSTFMGNAGILLRAYIYIAMQGREGVRKTGQIATLNANYLMHKLQKNGFDLAFPTRRASHEFIITFKRQAKEHGLTALDFAKRLLDEGYHAPTIYFPLLVPECWLIEPTETETKATLDRFVDTLIKILGEVESNPDRIRQSPINLPVRRLDEVKAAKELEVIFSYD